MENSLGVKVVRNNYQPENAKKKNKKKKEFVSKGYSPHCFHTYPMELTKRICSTIKGFFSWWLFPLLSWPWICDSGVTALGEIRCWSLFGVKGSSTLLFLVNKQSLCIPYDPVNEQIIMLHYSDLERVSWPSCGIPWSCSHHSKRHKSVQVWIRMDKHCIHGTHWLCFSS